MKEPEEDRPTFEGDEPENEPTEGDPPDEFSSEGISLEPEIDPSL